MSRDTQEIRFPNLTPTTGPARKVSEPLKIGDLMSAQVAAVTPDQGRWFVALVRPNVSWMKLSAWFTPDASGAAEEKAFALPRPDQFAGIKSLFGVDGPVLKRYLIGMIGRTSKVIITVEIDTNDPSLKELGPGPHEFTIVIRSAALVERKPFPSERDLKIVIEEVKQRRVYDGYVALDLGNTSSALVRHEGPAGQDPEVHLTDVESPYNDPDPGPAPSALWLSDYVRSADGREYPEAKWEIGKTALSGDRPPESLFLGAKRLLSDQTRRDDDGTVPVVLGKQQRKLPRSAPAELYIARMLQAFLAKLKSHPEGLALTCPTTFSRSEVEELKLAVYHAWRRALGETSRLHPTPEELRRVVWDVIDEASAAAFYFVHKDFLRREVPGRIPGFRYTYPEGMTLLLYDCGGGTTDIALVRVEAPENRRVRFHVLGRAGHRNFGGDAMTMAVYLALKARLARFLRPDSLLIGDGPALGRALADRSKLREIDAAVPTAFSRGGDEERTEAEREEVRRRRKRTMVLWKVAEALKHKLAEVKEVQRSVSLKEAGLSPADMLKLLNELGLKPERQPELEKVAVSRREVDPMLIEAVRQSVRYARNLIQKRLEPGREVDWVYVVGNASRYPLIAETLLDPMHGLPIRFLKERMMPVEPKDLKNSVAKGALTALMVSKLANFQFSAEFDQGLMDRLCFDVKRSGLDAMTDKALFRENTPYDQLGSQPIEMPERLDNRSDASAMTISRTWPGDTEDESYLYFVSSEVMRGTFVISYDAVPELEGRRRFVIRKTEKDGTPVGNQIIGYSAEAGLRDSPVQIGESDWPEVRVPKDLT